MSLDTESSKCGQQRETEAKRSILSWAAEAVNCCMDMFMLSTHSTVYVSFRYCFLVTGCGATHLGKVTMIVRQH